MADNKGDDGKDKGKQADDIGDHNGHFEPLEATLSRYSSVISLLLSRLPSPADPALDELAVYRVLRGHKFNKDKAEQALKIAYQYRRAHDLTAIRSLCSADPSCFPNSALVSRHFPHCVSHGEDKRGQPVSYERIGLINPAVFLSSVSLPQLLAYHHYHLEYKASLLHRLSLSRGHVVRLCKVTDMAGIGKQHLSTGCFKYVRAITDISQSLHAEVLGDFYIVNAPALFHLAWRAIRPWLSESTLSKIHIYGTDFLGDLQKQIPIENIPAFLGGGCSCGCVPLAEPQRAAAVGARKSETVKGNIEEIIAQLGEEDELVADLEFRCDGKDIAFQLSLTGSSTGPDGPPSLLVLIPKRRADTAANALVKESASIKKAALNGQLYTSYELIFDNSYSYLTSKSVHYDIAWRVAERDGGGQAEEEQKIREIVKQVEEDTHDINDSSST